LSGEREREKEGRQRTDRERAAGEQLLSSVGILVAPVGEQEAVDEAAQLVGPRRAGGGSEPPASTRATGPPYPEAGEGGVVAAIVLVHDLVLPFLFLPLL
jgi:hypothetical protein